MVYHRLQFAICCLLFLYQSHLLLFIAGSIVRYSFLQLYQAVYSLMSPGIGTGFIAGAHWRLPGGNGGISLAAYSLFAGGNFWVSGFDIIYALQDEEFDKIK